MYEMDNYAGYFENYLDRSDIESAFVDETQNIIDKKISNFEKSLLIVNLSTAYENRLYGLRIEL